MADPGGTRLLFEGHPAFPRPRKHPRHWVRRIVIGLVVVGIIGVGLYFGVPWLEYELKTVSTDDAFVSGHITNVSPRIEDVVTDVLVDQDDRVEAGTLLVKLDRQPFELAAAQAEASLTEARANLVQARRRSSP